MFERVPSSGRGDDAVAVALDCLEAGIRRADAGRATREDVTLDGDDLVVADEHVSLADVERVVVLGGGKGSDRVAAALVDVLDGRVTDGVVVVDERTADVETGPVDVRVGDHPVPSARGVENAEAVREMAESAGEDALVLAVVTGGASALLPAPAGDVPLSALQSVTRDLLEAGASIAEVNAVRKHVSTLKGGQLAAAAWPARVVTVVLSDVVGDDPSVVGSGPTAPDDSTYADAMATLERYDVDASAVRAHLDAGADGEYAETPDADHPCVGRTSYHVLASARTAVAGAVDAASDRGFDPCVLSTTVTGEAREAGGFYAAVGREVASAGAPVEAPAVLISGGETTVTVRGDGRGGPNQEFVLGAALDLANGPSLGEDVAVAVAAVDTDGRDGSTDAAGAALAGDALVASGSAAVAENSTPAATSAPAESAAARDALAANDAYGFLDERDALLRCGATGTNVNDLRVVVVQRP